MKTQKLIGLTVAVVMAIMAGSASATVLIDKDNGNGGFENDKPSPWFGQDDPPENVLENTKGLSKDVTQYYHVKTTGGGKTRKLDSLCQSIEKVDPTNGRTFTVSADVSGTDEFPMSGVTGDLVFFKGKEILGTVNLKFQSLQGQSWTRWEPDPVEAPSQWEGGMVQLRIVFFVDGGSTEALYEALIDNVVFSQDAAK